ncbi:hypothetical protein CIB95_11985 [Lottiidibacillus patelloidae]|uniref:Diguanylate cyclase n=1 Tax=Lottiidibacillus patelloidae TaxID=2670334 RepID=A0A263BRZ7_9BACI|nr:diguanylate cyclase [Lottiidibacillus patelloidae]OZM56489.1 hypothetical protein CIB95_11985 [Lottiidibacillus patelloidae]
MHYKGRLTAVAFILSFRGIWFYYYNFLYGHTLHFSEVTITILLLFPAWWIGKQFDQVSELKQKLELRKEKLLKEIRVSENRYNNFVEKSPNFVVIYDTEGKITYANKKTLSLLEAENESEVLGKSMLDFIDPIQHDEGRKRLNDALQHIPVEPIEYKVITLKKRIIYIESVVMQITDEGKQALMFVALDVTKRKEAEMLRNQQERNYESLVKTSPIGIIVHKNEKIIWVNPAALKIAGVQHEHDLIGTSLTKLIEPTKIDIINERIQKIEQGHQVKPIEYKIIRPDGSFIYAEINGYKTNFQGQDVILSFAVDITERKKQLEKINDLAYYDTLTSLPNRNLLTRHLESAITDAIENGKKGYTLFLDLDRFKNINDTYGHSSGDELLKKVTEKLKSMSLLKNEFISRYGGDEFIIVINSNKSISEVAFIAEEISSILRKPVFVRGLPMYISTSIGISIFPRDGQDSDTLIKNADIAMYTAKESGRDNYKFYSNNLYEENVRRMEIERELRTAIEKKQLYLQYQPKVEIKTNKVIGSEALLRWNNKKMDRRRLARC